jgi:hypothetical protein
MFSYFETSLGEKATNIKKGGTMPMKKECACGCKTTKKAAPKKVAAKKTVKKAVKKTVKK